MSEGQKLWNAANRGDLVEVQRCLNNGADVNWKDNGGGTPLHWASQNGHVDVVKFLVERGANVDATTKDGRTPLHWASQNGHVDVVKCLVERGANVNATAEEGWTPLHWASQNGHVDVVKCLVERGANVNATTKDRRTPLHIASQNGHMKLVEILLAAGADLFAIDKYQQTPRDYAASQKHTAVVTALDQFVKDRDQATKAFTPNAVRKLVMAEDPSIQTFLHSDNAMAIFRSVVNNPTLFQRHETLLRPFWTYLVNLDKAASPRQPHDVATPTKSTTDLCEAVKRGDLAQVQKCVNDGADVNWRGKLGETPLHWASWNGHTAVVEMLLENGGTVDATDDNGETPLHWASMNGHAVVVKTLIETGATVDTDGWTPLHHASLSGHVDVVVILLENGANMDAKDERNGETPLHWASRLGHVKIVEKLLAAGADLFVTSKDGTTPRDFAASQKHTAVVTALDQCAKDREQAAKVFTPSAVRKLVMAEDRSIQNFLESDEAMAIFRSVVNNPTLFQCHKTLLKPVLTYLVKLDKAAPPRQPQDAATPTNFTKDLYEAVKRGDLAQVQKCVNDGADVNWRGELGETPLHWASWNGHTAVVEMLLENGSTVDATDSNGETPLHWASMTGHVDVVKTLIETGATVDTDGWTPLHHASLSGHVDVVEILLENGANMDAGDGTNDETPLHWASRLGRVKVVERLLAAGADLFVTSKDGKSPRDVAASQKHTAVVTALDHCAKDRALAYFCAGDHAMAEKHATLVVTALKLNKSALAWIGDVLHRQGQFKQALAAFEKGKHVDPTDVDSFVGREVVAVTIQVASAFGQKDLFAMLVKDQRMLDYLQHKAFASIVKSVHANPDLYDRKNDKTTVSAPSPVREPSPPSFPVTVVTEDGVANSLPVKASLAELTSYLRLPDKPKTWRLSDTYNLVTDRVAECNHCTFKAENPNRRHAQLVVKLTDQETEVDFYRRMSEREDAAHVSNVVECFQICPVPMAAGAAKCFALVMERGDRVDSSHLEMLRCQPRLGLECIQKVASALEFLHGQQVIHGDVKLENLMHFANGSGYKLVDFDHTVPIGSAMRSYCTHEYCPPEMARLILQRNDHATMAASPTFDVWCLGVLALKLFVDGGHLEELEGVNGDGILEIVAAPGFTFHKSLAKVTQLNTRQKKYLLKCLEPDASKRPDSLRAISKLTQIHSITATASTPPVIADTPCQLPCLLSVAMLNDKRRVPRGDVLRSLQCGIGVVNSPVAACTFNQDNFATVLAGSDAVAMALPFYRVLAVYVDVLDALEDHGADVSGLKVAFGQMESIKATVDALESIHAATDVLPFESQLRRFDTRLTQEVMAPAEVEDIREGVDHALREFAASTDTYDRAAAVLTALGQQCTETAPVVVGGLVEQVNPTTERVTWKCHGHSSTPHTLANDAVGAASVPASSDFPMLWSLDAVADLGNSIKIPTSLRRERFRVVFQCEWCASVCKRESLEEDASNDAKLELVGHARAIRELLPMLKVSSLVLRALRVASLAHLSLDGFQFDLTKVELGSQVVAAMESLHGPTPSLDCEATFASILSRLDADDSDDAEMADEVKKLHDALMAYRVAVGPKMMHVLASLGLDWTRQRLGGLHLVTLPTGHSRWVCDSHETTT